jgi:hypothetical protein
MSLLKNQEPAAHPDSAALRGDAVEGLGSSLIRRRKDSLRMTQQPLTKSTHDSFLLSREMPYFPLIVNGMMLPSSLMK